MSVQFFFFFFFFFYSFFSFFAVNPFLKAAIGRITWDFSEATEDDSEAIPSRWLREVIQYDEEGRATITVVGALCCGPFLISNLFPGIVNPTSFGRRGDRVGVAASASCIIYTGGMVQTAVCCYLEVLNLFNQVLLGYIHSSQGHTAATPPHRSTLTGISTKTAWGMGLCAQLL